MSKGMENGIGGNSGQPVMAGLSREPLAHTAKRDEIPMWKAWTTRLIAVPLSLMVCAVVISGLTKLNPTEVCKAIFSGTMGTSRRTWVTIRDAMVLLCIAIDLTLVSKMRFWNIGAKGQVLVGSVATAAVMIYGGGSMPTQLTFLVMTVCSIAASIVWGLIPPIFKAVWNTNETPFTLALNYMAMQIVTFCIVFWEDPLGSNTVDIINSASKAGWLPSLFGMTYGWNAVIVLALTLGMYIHLRYNKQGYEIVVVGESKDMTKYVGINVKEVIMWTMAIPGDICGIAGFTLVSRASHTISTGTAGGRGFAAIIVAWLSKFNVFAMILMSFFLVFIQKGVMQIAFQFNLNENASDVIAGIILFLTLGSEFLINYKVEPRGRRKED